jgi:hypothetical protein
MNHPIELTREMIEDCIINSKVFRDAIIDNIMLAQRPNLHEELLQAMHESVQPNHIGTGNTMNKIAFIKAIRALSQNRCREFVERFPSIISGSSYFGPNPMTTLGLADSKHLAESYISLHYKP